MALTVYKYPIGIQDHVTVEMPVGAKVLHVAEQREQLCFWALVDPSAVLTKRRFRIAGTGHPVSDAIGSHVGTVLIAEGALVFHVFEMPHLA